MCSYNQDISSCNAQTEPCVFCVGGVFTRQKEVREIQPLGANYGISAYGKGVPFVGDKIYYLKVIFTYTMLLFYILYLSIIHIIII